MCSSRKGRSTASKSSRSDHVSLRDREQLAALSELDGDEARVFLPRRILSESESQSVANGIKRVAASRPSRPVVSSRGYSPAAVRKVAQELAETDGYVNLEGMLVDSDDGAARCTFDAEFEGWPVLSDWLTVGILLRELFEVLDDDECFVFELSRPSQSQDNEYQLEEPVGLGMYIAVELRRHLLRAVANSNRE